ncbi:acid phosphatase [Haemophilus influenzae]|nr:acid phosphatase [Haemophilus influenzae]
MNRLSVLSKKQNYLPEFKLNIIQVVKNGQFSAEAAYLHFGITNSDVVFQWLQAFEKQGINGLILKSKSRPIMKPKYPKIPPKPKT